jgi:hypothetical protein
MMAHRDNTPLTDGSKQLLTEIEEHVNAYGADFKITRSSVDEECERELEKEVEQEEERVLPKMEPRFELDWNYKEVMTCDGSFEALAQLTDDNLVRLSDVWSQETIYNKEHNLELLENGTVNANVFCTRNFLLTVRQTVNGSIEEYLRPVDAMLYFPKKKTFLLLSEREADNILALLSVPMSPTPTAPVQFVHLTYLKLAHEKPESASHLLSRPFNDLDVTALVALQLFNGDTDYPTQKAEGKSDEDLSSCRQAAREDCPECRSAPPWNERVTRDDFSQRPGGRVYEGHLRTHDQTDVHTNTTGICDCKGFVALVACM